VSASATSRTFPFKIVLAWSCLVAPLIYLYWEVFQSLGRTWVHVPSYSHGFFVPFVSLWMIWEYRHRLTSIKATPNFLLGMPLMIGACLLLIFGKASMVNIVQQGSLLVMICGMILLICGNHYMAVLSMPVAYLILMFPFLDGLFRQIQWPFQLLSAQMAVAMLKELGIPVLLEDNYIVLPSITLEVVRACSGIHYMVSIIAIVVPLMFIFHRHKGARLLLVCIAVFIGISVNWLRLVLIALWVYYGGENLHGPGHIFQGMFVSVFGFFVLFLAAWGLGKLTAKSPSNGKPSSEKETAAIHYDDRDKVKIAKAWLTALAIILATAGYTYLHSVKPVTLSNDLRNLPTAFGTWRLVNSSRNFLEVFNTREADETFKGIYRNREGARVHLYIAYFELQRQGKEIIHSNLQDLYDVSEGIKITADSVDELPVYTALSSLEGKTVLSYYWYDINGRQFGNNAMAKIYSAVDVVFNKRSNAAIIGVSMPVATKENQYEQEEIIMEFIRESFPVISRHLLNVAADYSDGI